MLLKLHTRHLGLWAHFLFFDRLGPFMQNISIGKLFRPFIFRINFWHTFRGPIFTRFLHLLFDFFLIDSYRSHDPTYHSCSWLNFHLFQAKIFFLGETWRIGRVGSSDRYFSNKVKLTSKIQKKNTCQLIYRKCVKNRFLKVLVNIRGLVWMTSFNNNNFYWDCLVWCTPSLNKLGYCNTGSTDLFV